MSQAFMNYLFIGLSFAIYITIAIRSRAGSTKEFYVAGGGVSPLANGMATAADWMSAATFISMAGTVVISGYDGSRFLMGWTGGFVVVWTAYVVFGADVLHLDTVQIVVGRQKLVETFARGRVRNDVKRHR